MTTIVNNARYVPVQRTFRNKMSTFNFDSWAIQDTSVSLEASEISRYVTDEEGLIIIFYDRGRAQEYADELLQRDLEAER